MISLKDYKKCRKIVIEEVFRALRDNMQRGDMLHMSGTALEILKNQLAYNPTMQMIDTNYELRKKWEEMKDVS